MVARTLVVSIDAGSVVVMSRSSTVRSASFASGDRALVVLVERGVGRTERVRM